MRLILWKKLNRLFSQPSTIAKIWKQPKCPSADEWTKKAVVLLHTGILLSHKKEGNLTFCNSMDKPGKYYAK